MGASLFVGEQTSVHRVVPNVFSEARSPYPGVTAEMGAYLSLLASAFC